MIPLTAAARFHFERSSKPVWYIVIEKETVDTWTIGGSTYDTVCFCAGVPGWSTPAGWKRYTDRMNAKSFKDVTFKLPMDIQRGGVAAINDFTFSVSELGGLMRDFENGAVHLDGRRAELWVSPDRSLTTRDNDIQVGGGIITDTPNKKNAIEFRVEGTERKYTRPCPPSIYDPENVSLDNIHLANETRGEPVPMVIGDHDMAEGFTVTDAVNIGSTDYGRAVQFCDEDISEIFGGSVMGMKWGDSGLLSANNDGMASVQWLFSTMTLSADRGMLFFDNPNATILYLSVHVRFTGGTQQASFFGAWNPGGPIDDYDGNYAIVYGADATGGGGTKYRGIVYKFPTLSTAMNIDTIMIGGRHKAFFGSNGSEQQIFMINDALPTLDSHLFPVMGNCWWAMRTSWALGEDVTGFQYLAASGTAPATDLTGLSKCFVTFYNLNFHTINSGDDWYLYDIEALVNGTIDFPARGFYMAFKGYRDDNTIIPSPVTLIENPAHIAAFLWSKTSGAGVGALNIQEFRDTAATLTAAGVLGFAKNIREQRDVEEYVDEVCLEGGLWTWFDRTGTVRCFPSGARQASESVTMLDRRMVAPGMLDSWDLTPLNEVVQDFTIRYHHNPVKDDFDRTLFCNRSTASADVPAASQTACGDSADRYNVELKKTFDLEWTRTREGALAQLERLIDWHTTRRWIIEWTSDLTMANMEIGDVVSLSPEISNALALPASLAAAEFRISFIRFSPSKNTVKFKAVQT